MFKRLMRAVSFFINSIVLASIVAVTIAHASGWEIKKLERAESIECLALNIYWETRAVSMADAVSVTDVVYNRVESRHFPNKICDVIHQGKQYSNGQMKRNQCQFSWYCDGKKDIPTDDTAWEKSRKYASDFYIYSKYIGITEGATHYHATYVRPYWAPTLDRITRIGSHIFYRMKGG